MSNNLTLIAQRMIAEGGDVSFRESIATSILTSGLLFVVITYSTVANVLSANELWLSSFYICLPLTHLASICSNSASFNSVLLRFAKGTFRIQTNTSVNT